MTMMKQDQMAKQTADMTSPAIDEGAHTYYLVREDVLPEALQKTMRAKKLLSSGQASTIQEAVDAVQLSRSAYYKYKDGIYPLTEMKQERIITISMDLQHRSGVLSQVLALVANCEGNVLTIHQSIPLQGMANVVISVDVSNLQFSLTEMLEFIRKIEGVSRALVIGQG